MNQGFNPKIWVAIIAVLRQLLLARKTFLLAKLPTDILAAQDKAAEYQFSLVEALMRNQSEELRGLAGRFMGRYRSLTPHIPPANVTAFSEEGEQLLNQLQAALKQHQPATT